MGKSIQYLSLDYFKYKTLEKIGEMFGNNTAFSIRYANTYALVRVQMTDGSEKRAMVDYEEFIPTGQFGIAVQNIKSKRR